MTDLPIVTRRRLVTCPLMVSTLVSLFCAETWAGQNVKDPFEVGQQWAYQHEGPRPGSMEPNAIDGERIMHVIGVVEEPEGKQWIIDERFTKDKNVNNRLYVNAKRLLTTIEIKNEKREAIKLKYDPPVPHQIREMNIGEEETVETLLKMDSMDFTLPSTIVIRRLDNETITTPAGEFVDCRHFKFTIQSTFNIKIAKIPFIEELERWYHPKVNGLVKEVYRKGPVKFLTWSREGYTATSVLTAFGKEEVPAEIGITRKADNANPIKKQPSEIRRPAICALFLGATTFLITGIYIHRKRVRRNAKIKSNARLDSAT